MPRRIGDLRLRLPKPVEGYNGTLDATQIGPQCIQQTPRVRLDMPPQMLSDFVAAEVIPPGVPRPDSEDCTCSIPELWIVEAWCAHH